MRGLSRVHHGPIAVSSRLAVGVPEIKGGVIKHATVHSAWLARVIFGGDVCRRHGTEQHVGGGMEVAWRGGAAYKFASMLKRSVLLAPGAVAGVRCNLARAGTQRPGDSRTSCLYSVLRPPQALSLWRRPLVPGRPQQHGAHGWIHKQACARSQPTTRPGPPTSDREGVRRCARTDQQVSSSPSEWCSEPTGTEGERAGDRGTRARSWPRHTSSCRCYPFSGSGL